MGQTMPGFFSKGGSGDAKTPSSITDLTSTHSFNSQIKDGEYFIDFYAPWCTHCRKLMPTWESLSKSNKRGSTVVAKVDCTENSKVCKEVGVRGYPTLMYFKEGVLLEEYEGRRSLKDLEDYVETMNETCGANCDQQKLETVSNRKGDTLVRYFDQGGWVKEWVELSKRAQEAGVAVAQVDCSKHFGLCQKVGKPDGRSGPASSYLVMYTDGRPLRTVDTRSTRNVDDAWYQLHGKNETE
ncbi:unnamed protein product [Cyprideis torosa]|uniref:Uncharacterized protein n=1 Tax=Cyprideis torosa TaxID=163714 RepID=A0A7R8WPH2_9CRUS|nr:unnamed protein product [Cyprideis torosa]CAG0901541.1 unnamed protein product [Cyprideis torosa]